jgi:uncharacterized protein YggE
MNNQDRFWKFSAITVIVLAIFLAVLAVKELRSIYYVGSMDQSRTITVDGKGEYVTIPDIATISFTVTEKAKTVAEAQEKATAKLNPTIQAIKDAGVAEKDIKTTSYNINPEYEYNYANCSTSWCPPGKSVLSGYSVSQSTEIKVRDLSKVGDIFTLIGKKEVQNVYGPSFGIDDPDMAKAKAREDAIKDAKAEADVLAKLLGVRLVRIINYYEQGATPLYGYGMGGDMMVAKEAASAPEISTGEQKVTSNVSVIYEIR